MGLFTDKITIVTGGASGIGRGLVEELARRGAIITLADINIKLAEEVAAAITEDYTLPHQPQDYSSAGITYHEKYPQGVPC